MRILHLNSSFASVPVLAQAQRQLGDVSDVATFDLRYLKIACDHQLPLKSRRQSLQNIERLIRFWRLARKYDVLHFHYHSALPATMRYVDFPLWRLLGKKVVMHYRGDDIRRHRHIMPEVFANHVLVSTPDLLEYAPNATWIPPVIDNAYSYVGVSKHNGPLRIAHAPSDRIVKGTWYVEHAISVLQEQGVDVKLDLIEGLPFSQVMERYRQADIVIDQLLVGWYGGVAIEAMSLGKPVVCYIRPDLERHLNTNTIFTADKDTLVQRLKTLVEWPELRRTLSEQGYEYVKRVHDPITVSQRLRNLLQFG